MAAPGDVSLEEARSVDSVLRGGGEMGALMRSIDWSRTAVGPVERWPQSLRTALSILLETGFPMYIAWGPEFTQFYNDGYRPILGATKHPAAMGISTRETFAEIWDIIGPMFHGVMEGTPTTVVDFLLPLDRYGFVEECYFIFSYSPIRQEDGAVGGVLVTVTETTERVLGERRLRITQALAARTRESATVAEACRIAAAVLAEDPDDLPFALIYRLDAGERLATLAGAAGLAPGGPAAPERIDLAAAGAPWPLAAALGARQPVPVEPLPAGVELAGDAPPPLRAVALPIREQGTGRALGVLVAGLSPRLLHDDAYDRFLVMLASQIGTAVVSARAYEEARARAEALAELDRLKTAFFSNVSHEFRTPLTLMLGPTEEAMASQDRALSGEDLETVYRNQLRLLKLVNTLLDFSRIEAGRATACFEPTDLATVTAHLASAFRSAVERAGLELVVRCPPLPEPVWVDRSLWEKVVLNLLSNALKFTFEGRIEVALGWRGEAVELVVRDTGVGIAPDHLAHVFDRFHRVTSTRARTQEGSGIGLALVRELVGMHGGTIEVESRVGEGTAFRVTIPAGRAHLPADQVAESPPGERPASGAPAFVEEALRWLPEDAEREPPPAPANGSDVRILVADDNADMRAYLARLLGERWSVETVGDGLAAWEAVRRAAPDLVLTDVMMPGLDGFELLHRLREDERTRAVPVIVLSARAGEESRVEGLDAGADDYLVKPFSAREIVARIQAQLVRAKVRSVEEAHSRRLAGIFAQAPVAVAILRGPEHVFELANPRYVELVGGREVAGKPVREALPELAGQGIYELLDRVYRSGEPHIGRALHVRVRQGPELVDCFFDFVYQPLVGDDGAVSGIAVVVYEVSELVRARREAEAASRAKDDFLAMLGHELRNPLAPILTALELMRLRGHEEGMRERAVIERQVKHLVGLVDDLLDVSRIARGGVELARQRVEIADVVARAVEMTAPAIEERRHELSLDVPRGLAVDGDARRLAQVIGNLIANAAKYTDPGGRVSVEARREGDEAVVVVADTGVGIDPEILPRVFDLFVQERQPIDRSQGGLGLGLAIVRSLVAAHGGRVSAESEGRGRGSRLIVRLPLAAERGAEPPAAAAESAPRPAAGGLSLLVVDDNRDAAEMLAHALGHLGHRVRVALDGPSALALLSTFHADAAILDLGLPVMDGFELAERLRADERTAGLRLIALTGYGRPDDQERSRAAGFDGHLVKPANAEMLDRVLREGRGAG